MPSPVSNGPQLSFIHIIHQSTHTTLRRIRPPYPPNSPLPHTRFHRLSRLQKAPILDSVNLGRISVKRYKKS
jgi:hypothetical protein